MKRIEGVVYANQAEALMQVDKQMNSLDQELRNRDIVGPEATMIKMLIHIEMVNLVMSLFEVKEDNNE